MKYDVLVIGGGLGGLLTAYILCKNGMNVAVAEKNPVYGGCLRTFHRSGYAFDSGMHYVGSLDEGQILNKYWKYFQLLDKIKLSKLDDKAFDIVSIGGKRYSSAMGYEAYIDQLSSYFPSERKSISDYVACLKTVTNSSPVSRLELSDSALPPLDADYVKTAASEYLERFTNNVRLRNVLAGNVPLYAGQRDKTPFYVHAFIHNSYIQSAYRIVGGSQTVANALVREISDMGGTMLNNCEVSELFGKNGELTYAKMSDGRIIESSLFISSIHPQSLVHMLHPDLVKRSYVRRINHMDNSVSCLTLYIGFKKNTVPYLNSNFFHYDCDDVWDSINYTEGDWPKGYLFMHQAPSDGGKWSESALVISYMRYEDVLKWDSTSIGRRGEDYNDFKQRKAEILLKKVEEQFPGISANIETINVSTPLTYRDFTHTVNGSMYGISKDVTAVVQTAVSQRTYIPNLLMTGQSTNSHGMLGVTTSAMLTCAALLGMNKIITDINNG